MTLQELDRVSQGMIEGCANYTGDPEEGAHCNDCTLSIDAHIRERVAWGLKNDDMSLIIVQQRAGLS